VIVPDWPPPELREDPTFLFHHAGSVLEAEKHQTAIDRVVVWSPYPIHSFTMKEASQDGTHIRIMYFLFPSDRPTQWNEAVAQLIFIIRLGAESGNIQECWVDALQEHELPDPARQPSRRGRWTWLVFAVVVAIIAAAITAGRWAKADFWTDPDSGLTWQVVATRAPTDQQAALAYCRNLRLGRHDDWRLPTTRELRTLITGCPAAAASGPCRVTDACLSSDCAAACADCTHDGGPTAGCYWPRRLKGSCGWYWSQSMVADQAGVGWAVNFEYGAVSPLVAGPAAYAFARCVRH
jgi:hypothetical protein